MHTQPLVASDPACAVLAASPIAQALVAADGRLFYANPAWCEQIGDLPPAWRTVGHNGGPVQIEETGRRMTIAALADGRRLLSVENIAPETRRLEARLRASEQRLGAALAAARLGTWRWDIAHGTIDWDASLRGVVGLGDTDPTPDAAAFSEWIHPDDRERVDASLQSALTGPDDYDVLFRLRHCDGAWHWHRSRGQVERQDGKPVAMIGACIDLNDLKTTEEHLARKAIELERSNAELEQFAYIASHDLQEPLRMITSYLGILQRRYAALFDERARQYFAYAIGGAERMRDLIRAVLDYSHAGAGPLVSEPFPCGHALADALANLRGTLAASHAAVHADPLPTLRANRTQLIRVFQNLISNALKFRRAEVAPAIVIRARDSDEGWVISVSDNGIGIAAEDHQRLFQIFQRLHAIDRYPGSGIGLATCRKIIDRHGGRIWVEAQAGPGATFAFLIPR
ncbi:MAG: PAS domain-containing protein [Planctomycetes bacterium]|nr:PAS domain-containing protein [Planctomycetota bacterium]